MAQWQRFALDDPDRRRRAMEPVRPFLPMSQEDADEATAWVIWSTYKTFLRRAPFWTFAPEAVRLSHEGFVPLFVLGPDDIRRRLVVRILSSLAPACVSLDPCENLVGKPVRMQMAYRPFLFGATRIRDRDFREIYPTSVQVTGPTPKVSRDDVATACGEVSRRVLFQLVDDMATLKMAPEGFADLLPETMGAVR